MKRQKKSENLLYTNKILEMCGFMCYTISMTAKVCPDVVFKWKTGQF